MIDFKISNIKLFSFLLVFIHSMPLKTLLDYLRRQQILELSKESNHNIFKTNAKSDLSRL